MSSNRRASLVPLLLATCLAPATFVAAQPAVTVGGETISRAEIEAPLAFRLYKLEARIHQLLREEAEARADDLLLAQEARRRGVSVEELLAATAASTEPVTDADVDAYLAAHPARDATPEQARTRVAHYLAESRRHGARDALLERLRAEHEVVIHLEPPEPPRVALDLSELPMAEMTGPADAPVTVVVFGDDGETSRRVSRRLDELAAEHPNALRRGFSPFVTPYDEEALEAARQRLGGLAEVRAAQVLARRAGVRHAPTVFVNGRPWSGTFPIDQLDGLVEEEIRRNSPGSDFEPDPDIDSHGDMNR